MISALFLMAVLSADPVEAPLWGDSIPGPTSKDDKNVPTLTAWMAPADKANGTAVVVCPGGGYSGRAIDHEVVVNDRIMDEITYSEYDGSFENSKACKAYIQRERSNQN